MSQITSVIFDFGGVFTTSPVEAFAEFEQAHNLPPRFLGEVIKTNHHTNAWAQFERSEINRAAFNAAFAQETLAAGYEVSGDTLLGLLKLSMKPAMIAALKEVRQTGYKTGCITNNLPDLDSSQMLAEGESQHEAANLLTQFDHVIESSKAGVRKPEAAIYHMMCEALDSRPEQCVFLDDLGINLKGAAAVGMATIRVPFGDVQPAINELFALLNLNPKN